MTVFIAIWLLVILGLAAVGVDGGSWYLQRRQQQNAADMAAIAGAVQLATDVQNGVLASNGTPVTPTSSTSSVTGSSASCPSTGTTGYGVHQSAQLVSYANGFTNNQDGTCVTVNWPPTSGTHQVDTAVEVIVHKPAPLLLSAFVRAMGGLNPQTIGARAVAIYGQISQKICVLSLTSTLEIQGSSSINADCTFASDASLYGSNPQKSAIYVGGNTGTNDPPGTRLIGGFATVNGGTCTGCDTAVVSSTDITTTTPYYTGSSYTTDPFAQTTSTNSTPLADLGSYFTGMSALTTGQVTNYQGGTAPPPGLIYGLKVTANATLNLGSGLYVIGKGGLDVASGGVINCSGCTFIVTNGGYVTINGSSTAGTPDAALTAPTPSTPWLAGIDGTFLSDYGLSPAPSGLSSLDATTLQNDLSGVLFYGDGTKQSIINGTSGSTLSGALYFPNSNLELSGNASIDGTPNSSCLMAVAGSVTFIGNNYTGLDTAGCPSLNLPTVYVHYVKLVE